MHLTLEFDSDIPNPRVVKALIQQVLTDHYGPIAPTIDAHTITPIRNKERT
jgi:hypothetical protein